MNGRKRSRQAKEAKGEGKGGKAANHGFKGERLAGKGKKAEAIKAFQRDISIGPPDADARTLNLRLNEAVEHHRAGRLFEAEEIYRRILAADPEHPQALCLLGAIAHASGENEQALELITRAIAAKPDYADAHGNLGAVLLAVERDEEALASFDNALALDPNHAEALNNKGAALKKLGRVDEAVASYRKAIEVRLDYAEAHNNLGNAFKDLGALEDAVASYQEAVAIKPDYAEAHRNLGNAFRDLGAPDDAVASCQKAIALKPDYAEAHSNLGSAFRDLGALDDAVASCRKALAIKPDYAEAYSNLGNAFNDLGRLEDAVASYQNALALKPDLAEAYSNLGNTFKKLGRLEDAVDSHRKALAIKPDYAGAYSNMGTALKELGRLDDAVASYRKALAIKPDYAEAHSNLLLCEHYRVGITAAKLHQLHAEWDERHGKPLREFWPKHDNPKDPDKRLRIGFVSPDLGRHPVGYFLVRLLENRMQDEAEFICYSDRQPDDLTERLKAASDEWRDTKGISNEDLAGIIRADQIDILFDLAGHSGGNRLLMFVRKPVPIQVVWAGYVGTTGVKAMDYLLSDVYSTPINEDHYYQEKIIRMPDGWLCYDPPSYAPSVGPLPMKQKGIVTFGSFSNFAKINAEVMALWVKILEGVPNSRLILKYLAFDSDANRERLQPFLTTLGLDTSRLILEGESPHPDLLARYNDIDIALDPFPYSGGLTTCEALWMGVPVITLPGKSFASRHSLCHLSSLGLSELVARNTSDYVELALALANDAPRLASLRAGLRERMAQSPLCDGPKFARHFTSAMREIWREWCLR